MPVKASAMNAMKKARQERMDPLEMRENGNWLGSSLQFTEKFAGVHPFCHAMLSPNDPYYEADGGKCSLMGIVA